MILKKTEKLIIPHDLNAAIWHQNYNQKLNTVLPCNTNIVILCYKAGKKWYKYYTNTNKDLKYHSYLFDFKNNSSRCGLKKLKFWNQHIDHVS